MSLPSELLETAKLLASANAGAPSDADVRRSVSSSYYALFHTVLSAAADRFFGATKKSMPGYALVYRAYDHGRMKRNCEEIAKPVLSAAQSAQFGRNAFHADLRDFASLFVRLQSRRQRADYDPQAAFTPADARSAVAEAERAIASFNSAPDDERSDILALMLGGRT